MSVTLLNLLLSSSLPFSSPGHGFGPTKMSRAQTFPSYSTEPNEEVQPPLSRSSSYGFSYSSSLIQWHPESQRWPETVCPGPAWRGVAPSASWKTYCSTNWHGSDLAPIPREGSKLEFCFLGSVAKSFIYWISLGGKKSMFCNNRIDSHLNKQNWVWQQKPGRGEKFSQPCMGGGCFPAMPGW